MRAEYVEEGRDIQPRVTACFDGSDYCPLVRQ